MTDAPAQQLAGTVIEALCIGVGALPLPRVMAHQAARAVVLTAASAMGTQSGPRTLRQSICNDDG
jgi:hypothetical protein